MTTGSQNRFPILRMLEEATPPSTPPTGEVHFYVDEATKTLHGLDDAATDTDYGAGGGGGDVATDAIWDAAGDLAVGSGADTATVLAAGSEDDVLTIVSGVPAWAAPAGAAAAEIAPRVTETGSAYSGGTTSLAVTSAAWAAGSTVLAVVHSKGRVANSITQTNVTWTQRYTGNGNSMYVSVWTGVVAGGAAGTTATVALTGSNMVFVQLGKLPDEAAITAATLSGSSATASGTLSTIETTALTPGDLVLWGITADSPSSSYVGCTAAFAPFGTLFGGAGRSGLFYAPSNAASLWSIQSSGVAWFGAFIVLS
jgi:hypothetical protein